MANAPERGDGEIEAMADLNKVFLIGRLVADPVLRRTPNGTGVTDLGLATTRSWSAHDGERREETLFIDVTVWDRQAENCCQYLRKGRTVHVEGYLRKETWDDKNTGEKRSKIRLIAERVQFLDSRSSEPGGAPGGGMDDGFAPASARDSGPRRGAGAGRGPSGGHGEPRGPSGAGDSGPPSGRAPYASGGPVGNAAPDDFNEDEDIPF